MLDCSGIMSLR